MEIALWGAGALGAEVAAALRESPRYHIHGVIDTDERKQGTRLAGFPVISSADIHAKEIDGVLVCIIGTQGMADCIKTVHRMGLKAGIIRTPELILQGKRSTTEAMRWLKSDIFLPQVETHVSDQCNLNCTGCSHYCMANDTWDDMDFAEFQCDVQQLAAQIEIGRFYLLGGEPLLNPRLADYILAARSLLPETDLRLVTNGLLIPKQDTALWRAIREADCMVEISGYPPSMKMIEQIEHILRAHSISYTIRPIGSFLAVLGQQGDSDPMISQKYCLSSQCRFLRQGRLYKCPESALVGKLERKFGVSCFPVDEGLDIYADGFAMRLDTLDAPTALCRYCAEKPRAFLWENRHDAALEDWLA